MSPELTFFDNISLGLALLFVLVFTATRIRMVLISSGSCGSCSHSGAGVCSSSAPARKPAITNQVIGIIATDRIPIQLGVR